MALAMHLTLSHARAIAQRCQGLDIRRPGPDLAAHIDATGWIRTLGGIEGYIALHNRVAGVTRANVDAALKAGVIRVMPAVRGCIYLVPDHMTGVLLKLAGHLSRKRVDNELAKLGCSREELRVLGLAIVDALAAGGSGLSTDDLRKKLPAGLVRGFGDVGKKLGVSSNLPSALRELEFTGTVERGLAGGLDSQTYLWRRAVRDPMTGVPDDPLAWMTEVGRSYWRHAGFADKTDFAEWAGINQRDARSVALALGLTPVTIAAFGKEVYALPEVLETAPSAPSPAVRLLSFEDNLYALHGGVGPFVDPGDGDVQVRGWGSGRALVPLATAKHVESRTITTEGRIAGLWEWDPAGDEVVTSTLGRIDVGAVRDERASLRGLIREIGHGRSFSLDTDALVQQRATGLRETGEAVPGGCG